MPVLALCGLPLPAVELLFQHVGIAPFLLVDFHNLLGREDFPELIVVFFAYVQYLAALGEAFFYLLLYLGVCGQRLRFRFHSRRSRFLALRGLLAFIILHSRSSFK